MSAKNLKTVSTAEYKAIIATVEKYIEGLKLGDISLVKEAFHSEATMYGFSPDGSLMAGPISNLWTFMETHGPAPNISAVADIISITQTTAVVKVDMERDATDTDYTDNHTLLKQDGKWLIIAKVFHAYEK